MNASQLASLVLRGATALLCAIAALATRRDPLTGLPNRVGLAEAATAALATAARDGPPVVGAMLDSDHFKAINDGWGHAAGDAVLRGVLRPGEVLGRVGGEEFALLLPGVGTEAARPLRERLRAVAAMVPHPGAPERRAILSAGLAPVGGGGWGAGPGCAGERASRRRRFSLRRQGRRAEPGDGGGLTGARGGRAGWK